MLRANPCNPCLVAVRHWSGGGPMWIAQSIDTERLTRLVIWLWVRPSAPCMDGAAPAHARRVPDVDCFGASRLSATAFRQVSCSAVRACQCRQDVRGLQAMANAVGKRWVRGVVLYTGTEVIPFAANLHGLPISHLWAAHG